MFIFFLSEYEMSNFNIIRLQDQIRTADLQVEFLQKHGILNKSHTCVKCKTVITSVKHRAGTKFHFFECPKCHQQTSIRKKTIIYNKGISLRFFLMLAYFFICLNFTHKQLIHETNLSDEEDDPAAGPGPALSCHTTVDYTCAFR